MERTVRFLHLFGDLTVNRGHAVQREELAIELAHELLDCVRIASHDAFVQGVDDEAVHLFMVGERGAHDFRGAVDNAQGPIDGLRARDLPRLAGRAVFPREILGEQRRCVDAFKHFVAIRPGLQRKQSRRFAQAVADHRRGPYTEAPDEVARRGAEGDLAKQRRLVVLVHGVDRVRVPENLRLELVHQVLVLAVLLAVNLRPLHGEVPSHAQVLTAGTGIHKRQLTRGAQGIR